MIFPHMLFLPAVESLFVTPGTEVVPHFWSGWFLLCVAYLLSYIFLTESGRENLDPDTL